MPESIPISERILRQFATNAGTAAGVAVTERWKMQGQSSLANSMVIYADNSTAEETGSGPYNIITETLSVRAELLVAQTRSATISTDTEAQRWAAKIRAAVMGTLDRRRMTEAVTLEKLALDTRYLGMDSPIVAENQSEFVVVVNFEIEFDSSAHDPDTGPTQTLQTE